MCIFFISHCSIMKIIGAHLESILFFHVYIGI